MADDADMRNELSDMQQRADQLADEVRTTRTHTHTHVFMHTDILTETEDAQK